MRQGRYVYFSMENGFAIISILKSGYRKNHSYRIASWILGIPYKKSSKEEAVRKQQSRLVDVNSNMAL